MIKKIAILIIICFFIAFFVAILGGCGTFGTTDESLYGGPYGSAYRGYRYNVPVAPSRVGFNRPPAHFEESIFSFRIINETQNLHARCFIDGQEHTRMIRGQMMRAYIATESGVEAAALIPPGETSYLMFDGERHNMKCELYGGPVQVGPGGGSYVFKKFGTRWIRSFTPDQFPGRQYRIDEFEVLNYDRI